MSKGSNIVPYVCSGGASLQRPANKSQAYENITRVKHEDKQTGIYQRLTTKEKVSTGNRHVERGSRQVGVKDEYTTSTTLKIGNKRGYTEYSCEERVRDVKFEDSNKQQKVIGGFGYAKEYGVSGGGKWGYGFYNNNGNCYSDCGYGLTIMTRMIIRSSLGRN